MNQTRWVHIYLFLRDHGALGRTHIPSCRNQPSRWICSCRSLCYLQETSGIHDSIWLTVKVLFVSHFSSIRWPITLDRGKVSFNVSLIYRLPPLSASWVLFRKSSSFYSRIWLDCVFQSSANKLRSVHAHGFLQAYCIMTHCQVVLVTCWTGVNTQVSILVVVSC